MKKGLSAAHRDTDRDSDTEVRCPFPGKKQQNKRAGKLVSLYPTSTDVTFNIITVERWTECIVNGCSLYYIPLDQPSKSGSHIAFSCIFLAASIWNSFSVFLYLVTYILE